MGLLHSLLGAVGLASAGQVRTAQQRATDLKRAVGESREEAARWKEGDRVTIRYDRRNPGNSIWVGTA